MGRRLTLLAAVCLVLGVTMLAGPARAQEPNYPPPPPTTTTTEAPTTTTTEQVLPTTIVRETTTTEAEVIPPAPSTSDTVAGVVVSRPLPRTGNDFGVQVIAGAALTAAGLAFAVTARLRRQRVTYTRA